MSARKMTQAELEEFFESLCLADPVFEANYRALLAAKVDSAQLERVAQWLVQSAHARQRRSNQVEVK